MSYTNQHNPRDLLEMLDLIEYDIIESYRDDDRVDHKFIASLNNLAQYMVAREELNCIAASYDPFEKL